jgi:hypothetical protein
MMLQKLLEALLVYTLVVLCAAYSLWAFLPARLKRRAAVALMASSGRLRASRALQALAQQQAGCGAGCDSCSGSAKPAHAATEHKIQLIRRR